MTPNKFQQFCNDFVASLSQKLPRGKENYSVQLRRTDANICEIYVDKGNEAVVSQVNDTWFDKAVSEIVARLSLKYGGKKNND